MMQSLRQMITCRWAARRIQRYLDADPSVPLGPGEITRLEDHLAVCAKCTQTAQEHRALNRALSLWPGAPAPDAESVERLRSFLSGLTEAPKP